MAFKKVEKVEKKDYTEIAKELYLIKAQQKSLEKKEKELKAEMQEFLKKQPVDAKKNAYLAFNDSSGKLAYIKYEARQSVSLNNEKAMEYFKRKKLLDRVYKSETNYYFDQNEIALLVSENKVPFEDLEKISDKTLNYAIKFMKTKEEESAEGET